MSQICKGIVVTNTGSFYTVKVGESYYPCKVKGVFKLKGIRTTNPIAIGDRVTIEVSEEIDKKESVGWITEICPRSNYIIRRSSNLSKQAHILAANLDRALLVVTVNYPVTTTTFIDRFLATSEAYNVATTLVFNKIDAYDEADREVLKALRELYEAIGYPCYEVSAQTGEGIDTLLTHIAQGVTLISGHSGVGKSSLINRLVPTAALRTASISQAHNTGMHTTTYSTMLPLNSTEEAWLIDTPGIKGFGTIELEREQVGHYFPDIFAYSKECRFNNCTHTHEPGCAVLQAVEEGEIAPSRYISYLSIADDNEDDKYRNAY